MRHKRRIIFLTIFSLIIIFSFHNNNPSFGSDEDDINKILSEEELFLVVKRTNTEKEIITKSVTDNQDNFHFFAKIVYENGSFMIL